MNCGEFFVDCGELFVDCGELLTVEWLDGGSFWVFVDVLHS